MIVLAVLWVALLLLTLAWETAAVWALVILIVLLPALGLLALKSAGPVPVLATVALDYLALAGLNWLFDLDSHGALVLLVCAAVALAGLTLIDALPTAESAVPLPDEPPAPPLLRHDDPFDEED